MEWNRKRSGQSLVEIILATVLVLGVAILLLIPYGHKVSDFFSFNASQKNAEREFVSNVNTLFGVYSKEFLRNFNILKSTSSAAADSLKNLVSDLIKIKKGNGEELSDMDFKRILSELEANAKKGQTETSGSIAALTDLPGDAGRALAGIFNNKPIYLDTNSEYDGQTLSEIAQTATDMLKNKLLSGELPRTILAESEISLTLNGQPITQEQINNLSKAELEKLINENFGGTSSSETFTNTLLALENMEKSLPDDLKTQLDTLETAAKTSLTIDPSTVIAKDDKGAPCPGYSPPELGCHYEFTVNPDGCLVPANQVCDGKTTECPTYPSAKSGCHYQFTTESNGCQTPTREICCPAITCKTGCTCTYGTDADGCRTKASESCPQTCTDERCSSGCTCTFTTGADGCKDVRSQDCSSNDCEDEVCDDNCNCMYRTGSDGCKDIKSQSCLIGDDSSSSSSSTSSSSSSSGGDDGSSSSSGGGGGCGGCRTTPE